MIRFKKAQELYNNAISVECLIRNAETAVVPGSVQKGLVDNTRCFYMKTESGGYAVIVDNNENKTAKICKQKTK